MHILHNMYVLGCNNELVLKCVQPTVFKIYGVEQLGVVLVLNYVLLQR